MERAGRAGPGLSQARHGLAAQLEAEIKQELQDLYIRKRHALKCSSVRSKFNREGNEQVEFYISANPGEDFKPLSEGCVWQGALRLMLAIKSAFIMEARPTVFDEVDTGVSGRVAQAIAQKIHKIGSNGQSWPFPSAAGHCDCRLSVLY